MMEHPPKIDRYLNVGVTGHRDLSNSNIGPLRQQILKLLSDIRGIMPFEEQSPMWSTRPPGFRILSAIAEGSDRIAAHAGLELGYELQCCLPMTRDEYENDFLTESSRREYRDLLDRATAVFEIDSIPAGEPIMYLNAGEAILERSDVLLAVWDGKPPRGIGGTGDIVRRAQGTGIPVVWLSPFTPHPVTLITKNGECPYSAETLAKTMQEELFQLEQEERKALDAYYMEKRLKFNRWILYKCLFRLLLPGHLKPRLRFAVPDYQAASEDELAPKLKKDEVARTASPTWYEIIREHFGWADNLSIYYADIYRSISLLRNSFVFLATLGLAFGFYYGFWNNNDSVINALGFSAQAVFLLLIILLARMNKHLNWHRKYMDYRLLAETLRTDRYAHPLGKGRLKVMIPPYHKINYSWVNAYLRSLLRMLGLPNTAMRDEQKLYLQDFAEGIQRQIGFHTKNSERYSSAASMLENVSGRLFWIGIIFIVIRVAFHFYSHWVHTGCFSIELNTLKMWKTILNMFALVVPAFAAYVFSLHNHLGFEKLRERAAGMAAKLTRVKTRIDQLLTLLDEGKTVPFEDVKRVVSEGSTAMLEEVADWREFLAAKSIVEK